MSEACNGCKASKYAANSAASNVQPSVCSSSADMSECGCSLSKSRVQVRAKVLYGTGTAIANLRAKEKATNRPNL